MSLDNKIHIIMMMMMIIIIIIYIYNTEIRHKFYKRKYDQPIIDNQ